MARAADHGNITWSSIAPKMDPTSMMQAIEAVPKEFKKKEAEDKAKLQDQRKDAENTLSL